MSEQREQRARPPASGIDPDMLCVDLQGYSGPLDLMLDLAQRQKLDLTRIAIKPLAEQYLAHIAAAQSMRIELAADMLIMAAWLAYLKARLIAPKDSDEADDAEELAEHLAFRLRRLAAMREAADALFARPILGQDVFARGESDAPPPTVTTTFVGSLYDLIAAYAAVRQGEIVRDTTMEKRALFSLVDARSVMERVIGKGSEWLPLDAIVAAIPAATPRRPAVAATFGATLEMAREGLIDVRQAAPFAPIEIRGTGGEEKNG